MSFSIIVVEKLGSLKEITLKTLDEKELYKKAGFKSAEGFQLQTEWGANVNDKQYTISMYGKTDGRAGQENKYEFPPPIDTTLFFGACVLVNKVNGKPANLTVPEWKNIYEFLYGGFEDIGDEDEEEESEDSVDENVPRTKDGYVKDGFVVEDDDDEDDDDEDDEDDEEDDNDDNEVVEEEIIVKPKRSRASKSSTSLKTSSKTSSKTTKKTVFEMVEQASYLDCTSELSEEEYIE